MLRYRFSPRVALSADPGVLIGLNRRGELVNNVQGNATELITIPVKLQLQASPQLELDLTTGLDGSVSNPSFGDSYRIPVGIGFTFAFNHRVDAGADFTFGNPLGNQAPNTARTDLRYLGLRLAIRL